MILNLDTHLRQKLNNSIWIEKKVNYKRIIVSYVRNLFVQKYNYFLIAILSIDFIKKYMNFI